MGLFGYLFLGDVMEGRVPHNFRPNELNGVQRDTVRFAHGCLALYWCEHGEQLHTEYMASIILCCWSVLLIIPGNKPRIAVVDLELYVSYRGFFPFHVADNNRVGRLIY